MPKRHSYGCKDRLELSVGSRCDVFAAALFLGRRPWSDFCHCTKQGAKLRTDAQDWPYLQVAFELRLAFNLNVKMTNEEFAPMEMSYG